MGPRGFEEHAQDRNVVGSAVHVEFEAVAQRWMNILASWSLYSKLQVCLECSTMRQLMRGLLALYVFSLRSFC